MFKKTVIALIVTQACEVLAQESSSTNPNEVESITIYGDFRQQIIEQLSTSATVLSEARLASRQAEHLENMLGAIPNVNFTSGTSRGRFVQIRGIGERSQYSEPLNPSVSMLVDEFDFSGLGAAALLFDTQQVEVFRGPQATVFGTGALAGAVNIVSHQPTFDAQGYAELRAASKSSYRLEGGYGNALSDNIAFRVAAVSNVSDGFIRNAYLNRDDTNNLDESALRFAVRWDIAPTTQLDINTRWYDIDNGFDAFSLDNNGVTQSDNPGNDTQQTEAISLKLAQLTPFGTLSILATHAQHEIEYSYDEDWTYPDFHPWSYSSVDAYYRDIQTQTAEIRFASNNNLRLFDGTTDWVVGAHVKRVDEDLLRRYTYLDSDFGSIYTPTTTAVYVQTQSNLSDRMSLHIGLRNESYDFDYTDNAGLSRTFDSSMTGGKVALHYELANNLLGQPQAGQNFVYVSVARGYKGAGINPSLELSESNRFYDSEYNWNYELGYKGRLGDLASLRVAAFRMQRENTQVSDYALEYRDDGSAAFVDFIGNADVGVNQGVEFELDWQASEWWRVALNVGYLDATFEGYTNATGERVAARKQAQAPNTTLNLFSTLELNEQWIWQFDIDYKDTYRFSDGHDESAPAETLMHTELVYNNSAWQLSLWIKNLTNERYYVRGFGGFSNDPRDYYETPEPYYQLGAERQFGVTLRYVL